MQQWKEAGADTSYGPLLQQASESQISGIIDVDNPVFTNPADMEKPSPNIASATIRKFL